MFSKKKEEKEKPKKQIWQEVLHESSSNLNSSLSNKSILLLGNRNSGKTALLSRLQRKDTSDIVKGLALDYSLINVTEEDTDDVLARINVWQLEGEDKHKDLLEFAINKENIEDSLIVIVLDYSSPWDIESSLDHWLEIAQNHVRSLSLPNSILENIQIKSEDRFKNYKEPEKGVDKISKTFNLTDDSDNNDNTQNNNNDNNENDDDDDNNNESNSDFFNKNVVPLAKGALEENIGVPILVVCCKADAIHSIQRDFNFQENEFDFIQQHLRRKCLKYGASLVYVSTLNDLNCELLSDYIEHLLFNFNFIHEAELIEKDSVFVPIGWDSLDKIELNSSIDHNTPFSDIIKKPKRVLQQEMESDYLEIEHDQDFLSRCKNTLDKKDQISKKTTKKKKLQQSVSTPVTTINLNENNNENNGSSSNSKGSLKKPATNTTSDISAQFAALAKKANEKPKTKRKRTVKKSDKERTVMSDFFKGLLDKNDKTGKNKK